MYDIAVGDLGLSVEQFHRMTWGEFMCRYAGAARQDEKQLNQARLIMYAIFKKNNKRRLQLKDIFELPMDKAKPKAAKLMSRDEYQALKDKWQNVN